MSPRTASKVPIPRSGPARDEFGQAVTARIEPLPAPANDKPPGDMPVALAMPWPKVLPGTLASLATALPLEELPKPRLRRVYPATAVQRGQFRDRRSTHLHAGLDLAGKWGSKIVASFSGTVMRKPGGDRGYGPFVALINGDDGIVYRYAHLAKVIVSAGMRVLTGQQIGTMGKLGSGMPHLHFETMARAEFKRNPYGVHSLDPNKLLGGHRGATLVAGAVMPDSGKIQLASNDIAPKVERKVKRHRHAHKRGRHNTRIATR